MSREAWEDMHSDPILSAELGPVFSNYTKGGIQKWEPISPTRVPDTVFKMPKVTGLIGHHANRCREGYYGWMGFGGSVFQWNPEQQISFAYVPSDIFMLDGVSLRGGII